MNNTSSRPSCAIPAVCLLMLAILLPRAFAGTEPVVSNVIASQRPSTKLVDITYDLAYTGDQNIEITVLISDDGGQTFEVPAQTLSGAVGRDAAIQPGSGLQITWNAGVDFNQRFSPNAMVRIQPALWSPPDLGDDAEMALIPAGSFQMGDAFSEGSTEERPVHTVNVSAFYMDRYEVTKALWDEVRVWGSTRGYTDLRVGGGKGANHPVHTVSWLDVVKWCNARSERDGLTPVYTVAGNVMRTGTTAPEVNWNASGYRLPTEAEWEKAARGGLSGKRFPWGDTINHEYANYYANGSGFSYDTSAYTTWTHHPTYNDGVTPITSPVGSFAPNGYGLYDTAGNVWEWCWDWYSSSYYASSPSSDPRGPASGSYRVFRGGGWSLSAGHCRTVLRYYGLPGTYGDDLGFRSARSSVP